MISRLMDEHASLLPTLKALEDELHTALGHLVDDIRGGIHTITCRIKSPSSLAGKLARPDRTYHHLTDITDLVGVRIVTYFEDSIREIAERVEHHFTVDLERSVDKRRQQELDRFGYRSLHYICAPPHNFFPRHHLEPVPELRFEIQLRTILQHAWAEIEHDLGYKAGAAIPASSRRRFSRLAGLLELADQEFLSIKQELRRYEREVATSIASGPNSVALDRISLMAFLDDPSVREADAEVARLLDHDTTHHPFFPDYLVDMLSLVGLESIDEVEHAVAWAHPRLQDFVPTYFDFATRAWDLSAADVGPIQKGYSLLFVAHLRLLSGASLDVELVEEVTRFFCALDNPDDHDTARSLAALLIETLRS